MFLFGRQCSLGVGLGTAFCYALAEKQLGSLASLGRQLGLDHGHCCHKRICRALAKGKLGTPAFLHGLLVRAGLAVIVVSGQLKGASLATVVAGDFFKANSQNLSLEAAGEDVGQPDDLLADSGLQSVKQVSGPLRLANG